MTTLVHTVTVFILSFLLQVQITHTQWSFPTSGHSHFFLLLWKRMLHHPRVESLQHATRLSSQLRTSALKRACMRYRKLHDESSVEHLHFHVWNIETKGCKNAPLWSLLCSVSAQQLAIPLLSYSCLQLLWPCTDFCLFLCYLLLYRNMSACHIDKNLFFFVLRVPLPLQFFFQNSDNLGQN